MKGKFVNKGRTICLLGNVYLKGIGIRRERREKGIITISKITENAVRGSVFLTI